MDDLQPTPDSRRNKRQTYYWAPEQLIKIKEMIDEGKTSARIAEQLGTTRSAIKSLYRRRGGAENFDPYQQYKKSGGEKRSWSDLLAEKLEAIEMQIEIILDVLSQEK